MLLVSEEAACMDAISAILARHAASCPPRFPRTGAERRSSTCESTCEPRSTLTFAAPAACGRPRGGSGQWHQARGL